MVVAAFRSFSYETLLFSSLLFSSLLFSSLLFSSSASPFPVRTVARVIFYKTTISLFAHVLEVGKALLVLYQVSDMFRMFYGKRLHNIVSVKGIKLTKYYFMGISQPRTFFLSALLHRFSRHFNFANFAILKKKSKCRKNLLARKLSDVILKIK